MSKAPINRLMLALLAGTAISSSAFALDASGSVVKVDRITNASGPGGQRVLETDSNVFMGDAIVTNANGLAQIRFVDDTRIVVGPNSRMVIDSFVFNPNNTAEEVTVSAVKGVFRFISGKSPHEAYSIRTPTMTIGVRGTVIDINARGNESSVVFLEGSGQVCSQSESQSECVLVTSNCTLRVVERGSGVRTPGPQETQQRLAAFFPFVAGQSALDPAFWAYANNCSTDTRFTGPPVESYSRRHSPDTPY